MINGSILDLKIFRLSLFCAFFLLLGLFPKSAFSQEGPKDAKEKAKEAILEHIADSHSWPVIGKTSIPLPVILYTDKGFELFSSANVKEEEVNDELVRKTYQGAYYTYTAEHDKIKVVDGSGNIDEAATKKIWDFSITRNVVSLWMSGILLMLVFFSISSAYKKREGKAPKGLQSFIEPLIVFVRDDIAIPNMGLKYVRFMPLLLTIFFFILINNLIGIVPFFPGGYNLTGNIAVTATLSVIILFVVNLNGNKYYWKHIFLPSVPFWIVPIMWIVEIVGIFSKPIALMIRLFANMTAGHIVALSLISLIFIFGTLWVSPVSVAFVVFMDVIEVLIAFLQAYIFTLLSSLFIGMAMEEHH